MKTLKCVLNNILNLNHENVSFILSFHLILERYPENFKMCTEQYVVLKPKCQLFNYTKFVYKNKKYLHFVLNEV